MRIGIFGGSFDPPHKGHIGLAQGVSGSFDRLIIVPAFRSPFKSGQKAAEADLRLQMCREAFKQVSNAEISGFEMDQGSAVYTYRTLEHFAKEGELTLIIGSDSLLTLKDWQRPEKICRHRILTVRRAGYLTGIEEAAQELKEKFGAAIEFADFIPLDISSSEIKVAAAFGFVNEFVDPATAKIIEQNGLYNDYRALTDAFEKYGITEKRRQHTRSTALTAVRLAKIHGIDAQKAALAAILHDIGKYITVSRAQEAGYELSEKILDMPEPVRHAEIGAIIAECDFKMPQDIVKAIQCHTTGKAAMTGLEKVIFIADYIEPHRKFHGIERIRELADVSLDRTVAAICANTVEYLGREGVAIDKRTFEALEYYQRLHL